MHFAPLGNPARHAADGEHDGKHFGRNSQRPVEDAAVEVDIGIQLPLNEIIILQHGLFKFQGDIEQRVVYGASGQEMWRTCP